LDDPGKTGRFSEGMVVRLSSATPNPENFAQ
jgi:hypothetical protein